MVCGVGRQGKQGRNSSTERTITCSIKTTTFGIRKRVTPLKKPRYYRCITCKEKFPKLSLLNEHYRDRHPPLLCTVCDKEFVTPNGLEWHAYLHKTLKFKCTVCEAMFPFRSSMESHMLTHSTEKKHTCSQKGCTKSFYSKGDLTKHSKVHLNTAWKCSLCDYTSNDKRNLKARKHSLLKRYMCRSCMKLFKYHTQLKRHLPCSDPPAAGYDDVKPKPDLKHSDSPDY